MTYNLPDLDDDTRRRMLEEFESDAARGAVLPSAVVTPGREAEYLDAQRQAFAQHDPDWLAEKIEFSGMLATQQANGARVNATAAAKRLAAGQFGAYYARAVGGRAVDEGRAIEVYRARHSANPRAGSDAKIGTRPDPAALLADLRDNSTTPGSFAILPEVGSGISVKLV
ncbi:hypothetical protein [uncultured Microbacterium sp.]|uniref:hypothetical protein n=1 Tax=uncultured Microbacterium sp. TaxID=191216 RepID=UPI0028D0E8AD|nr:hypothetical protein [uncultured Microbacterium sp.]